MRKGDFIINIEKEKKNYKKTFLNNLRSIAIFLIYFSLSAILTLTAQGVIEIKIFSDYAVRGVIAQFQTILLIFLVLSSGKKAFIAAVIINIFSLSQVALAMKINSSPDLIPGLFSYLVSLIIIVVIRYYQKEITSKLNELKSDKEKIKKVAFQDNLTKIANREKIINRLDSLVSLKKEDHKFELIFIDFKNFKKINDSYGHFAGDYILKECSSRLKEIIHSKDYIGRLGGDEFAIILERELPKNETKKYVRKIKSHLEQPYNYKENTIILDINFGISYFPEDAENSHDLIKSSDIAMFKAKNDVNSSIEFFSEDMEENILTNIKIEEGLKNALNNNEFHLEFQPQYFADSEKIRGFETLLRWNSSEFGMISPADFIPIAEKTGLIKKIGNWVIKTAVAKFNYLSKLFDYKLNLSVNISVVQIMQPNFVEEVKKILKNKNSDFNLEFEITESVFISDQQYAIEKLYELKKLNIKFALDDFGTGYSSLNYLNHIPLDIIKIDKSFVDTIEYNYNEEKKMVAPIINLAHQLGMEVVAEGVETIEQLHYLEDYNCDYIQGYLFNKPLKLSEIEKIFSS